MDSKTVLCGSCKVSVFPKKVEYPFKNHTEAVFFFTLLWSYPLKLPLSDILNVINPLYISILSTLIEVIGFNHIKFI